MAILLLNSSAIQSALPKAVLAFGFVALLIVGWRMINCLFLHPLRHFPGPWYAACSSLPLGLASITSKEPDWLMSLVRKYGSTLGTPLVLVRTVKEINIALSGRIVTDTGLPRTRGRQANPHYTHSPVLL